MKASLIGACCGLLAAMFLASGSYYGYVAFGGDPRVVFGLMRSPDWWGIVGMSAIPLAVIGAVIPHAQKEPDT